TAQAELTPQLKNLGKELAKKAYQAVGCVGMARVDFFLESDGAYWLNEVNPIPGFTANSLYPLICQANGFELSALLDELIRLGLQQAEQKKLLMPKDQVLKM
ncbi:MAG: D-alanine--D-alanine ligase family protein, partial [Parachlamydiaceae bacterium]